MMQAEYAACKYSASTVTLNVGGRGHFQLADTGDDDFGLFRSIIELLARDACCVFTGLNSLNTYNYYP